LKEEMLTKKKKKAGEGTRFRGRGKLMGSRKKKKTRETILGKGAAGEKKERNKPW